MPLLAQGSTASNMPSFYPTYVPSHIPYAQDDYAAHGIRSSQYAMSHEPPTPYGSRQHRMSKDMTFPHHNPYDVYKSASAHGNYGQHHGYANAINMQHPTGAPVLQPLRIDNYSSQQIGYPKSRHADPPTYASQNREEEKVTGGVSARLDYDMEQMTDFVVQMTLEVYAAHNIYVPLTGIDLFSNSINPLAYNVETFRSWVLQVLNATRLPSATILLSLSYLTLRVRGLIMTREFNPSEYSLYELLTVSLILGSKFLDDNTFQNKSWAEVSNIKVEVLNKEERNWLRSFDHHLHHDPQCAQGYTYWEDRWTAYKSCHIPTSRSPSEASSCRQASMQSTTSPRRHSQYPMSAMSSMSAEHDVGLNQYPAQNYSSFNPWLQSRSAVDRSPSTAPHTGPNTPDHYSGYGGWGPIDPSSSRTQPYGYSTVPHYASGLDAYPPPPYDAPAFNYNGANVWNCHGAACQCASCRQAHVPRYGPIVVG